MKDNIKEAEDALRGGNVLPDTASDLRTKLAGEYSFYSSVLSDIESRYAKVWLAIREKTTSDKQADKEYSMTEDGINENGLKRKLKAIEKMLSALKTVIELSMNDRNNSNY